MEALCATINAPLVGLLRASGGCPVGEAMNAPLLQPQLAARAAALQARAGALLARVGEALEAGSGARDSSCFVSVPVVSSGLIMVVSVSRRIRNRPETGKPPWLARLPPAA
jgi:hypothetical protein